MRAVTRGRAAGHTATVVNSPRRAGTMRCASSAMPRTPSDRTSGRARRSRSKTHSLSPNASAIFPIRRRHSPRSSMCDASASSRSCGTGCQSVSCDWLGYKPFGESRYQRPCVGEDPDENISLSLQRFDAPDEAVHRVSLWNRVPIGKARSGFVLRSEPKSDAISAAVGDDLYPYR